MDQQEPEDGQEFGPGCYESQVISNSLHGYSFSREMLSAVT